MFVATTCPGPYLQSKLPWIAAQVNKQLSTTTKALYRVRKIWADIHSQVGAFADLENAKNACDKAGSAYSVFDASGKAVYSPVAAFKSYRVKVTADALNIRAGAGTQYKINGCIIDNGVYTIVDEQNGFGLLKSKAGWICLKYTERI